MDKCHMNKCCMDKCHCDSWNLFKMVPGTYLESLVKIVSVTAEILLTLSLCGVVGWVGFAQSFSCPTSNYIEVRLSLSWGCDNMGVRTRQG